MPKRIILKMLPEDEARYMAQRALIPEHVLHLARIFQKLAFAEEEFYSNFEPAPLYVSQAFQVWENKVRRAELALALGVLK